MVALSVEELGVEPVTDWLYRISAPAVNVYAIRQSGDVILVDAGLVGYERAYLGALAQITGATEDVRVSQIFLTHGHDDHTGSAAALAAITGAAIVGPALDQAVIEGRARRAEPQLLDWEVPLFERYGRVPAAPGVTLDATVADGDVLDWERPAQVVGAPGHTAGSVALFFAEEGVLIAGDAIMSLEGDLRLGVFNADPQQAERTLCRLVELDPATVCVGHGPVISRRS